MEFFFCLFFFPLIFAKPNPIFTLGFSTRVFLSTTVVVTVMTMIWRLFEIRQTLHLLSSSSTPPPRSLAVLDASAMPPPDFGAVWRGIVDSSGTTQSMSPLFKIMVPHPGQVVVLGPIFTPRKIKDDELELEILLMPITKLLFVVELQRRDCQAMM